MKANEVHEVNEVMKYVYVVSFGMGLWCLCVCLCQRSLISIAVRYILVTPYGVNARKGKIWSARSALRISCYTCWYRHSRQGCAHIVVADGTHRSLMPRL